MKKLIIILLCLIPLFSKAQLVACRNVIPDNYDFWLYLPKDYATAIEKKPVILFLHGRSLSGDDLSLVRHYGCINALLRGREIDAIVIAPQSKTAWKPEKLMELYNWVTTNYRSDTNRFYVLGMSMGGFGTLDFVAAYPDKVAAAMSMCGGSTAKSLCGLNDVPLWIIHGTADQDVPVWRSERVVDSMCVCGDTSRLIFNKLKSVNHTSLVRVFYLQQTYDWLFSHTLTDSLRLANKDYTISRELLYAAYDDLENKSDIQIIDLQSYKDSQKQYYVVKKGDTLSSIAVENNSTVSILCKLNNIRKDAKLWPGRKIRVK
jgi:hypothetical protein